MNSLEITALSFSSLLAAVNALQYRRYVQFQDLQAAESARLKAEQTTSLASLKSEHALEIQKLEAKNKAAIESSAILVNKLRKEIHDLHSQATTQAQNLIDQANCHRKEILEIQYQHKNELQQIHDLETKHRKQILELEHQHKMEIEESKSANKHSDAEISLLKNEAYEKGYDIGCTKTREAYSIVIEPYAKEDGFFFKSAITGYTATLYIGQMATGFVYDKVINSKQNLDKESIECVAANLVNVIKASSEFIAAANGIPISFNDARIEK